jgi:hypothetical protein
MSTDLPIPYTTLMQNNWEIIGQFMYPATAYRRLLDLLRSGLLDISAIRPRSIRWRPCRKPWKPPPAPATSNVS